MWTNGGDSPETVLQNEEDIRFLDIFNDSEEFEGFNVEEIDINQVVANLSQFAPDHDTFDELDRENDKVRRSSNVWVGTGIQI